MPRLARLLIAPLLTLGLLLPAAASAQASPLLAAAGVEGMELALEGGEEPQGLEPMGPDATDNEFAPENYESNFLWGAAIGLLGIVLLVLLGMGAAWYFLVVRPSQPSPRS